MLTRRLPSPRKRFGQHFLRNSKVIDEILDILAPEAGQRVLEPGSGRSALTGRLLASKVALTAVEVDRDLVSRLRSRWPALKLIEADILEFELPVLEPGEKWRLIGNLPYNISTPLLGRLPLWRTRIKNALFMLQAEVAERLAAGPGSKKRSRLGVMLQHQFDIALYRRIPPEDFYPPPAVYSRMVRLTPRRDVPTLEDSSLFARLVKAAFSQRRKTLKSALRGMLPDPSQLLNAVGISEGTRAEQLSVDDFVRLSNRLHRLVIDEPST